MQYTQDALFPDAEVTGTGRPIPWPTPVADDTEQAAPAQAETLPFDEDAA
ncbi:hypothetical protein ABT010_13185 [Streptomyces sp. NPDC002668]